MSRGKASYLGAMAMMFASMSLSGSGAGAGWSDNESYKKPKETPEQKAKREAKNRQKIALSNGLKEYDYNGKKVYAINQKNADKKAVKLGYKL